MESDGFFWYVVAGMIVVGAIAFGIEYLVKHRKHLKRSKGRRRR
jgi:hypothetical protein